MKLILVLAFVAVVAARPDDRDLSRYDNFDIDELISNKRLLKSYMQCFIETGKCTPEGTDFKKWIPQSVEDSCSKCSQKQKTLVAKVILAIKGDYPDGWVKLNQLYNPEGKHDKTLNEFIEKYGH